MMSVCVPRTLKIREITNTVTLLTDCVEIIVPDFRRCLKNANCHMLLLFTSTFKYGIETIERIQKPKGSLPLVHHRLRRLLVHLHCVFPLMLITQLHFPSTTDKKRSCYDHWR